jgi:hypothetical protein
MIGLLATLIIVGVLLWMVNTMIPMDPKIRQIVNVLVIIFVLLWLLSAFGVMPWGGVRVGRYS